MKFFDLLIREVRQVNDFYKEAEQAIKEQVECARMCSRGNVWLRCRCSHDSSET